MSTRSRADHQPTGPLVSAGSVAPQPGSAVEFDRAQTIGGIGSVGLANYGNDLVGPRIELNGGCAHIVHHGSLDPIDREANDRFRVLDNADDVDRVLTDGGAVDGFNQPQGQGRPPGGLGRGLDQRYLGKQAGPDAVRLVGQEPRECEARCLDVIASLRAEVVAPVRLCPLDRAFDFYRVRVIG